MSLLKLTLIPFSVFLAGSGAVMVYLANAQPAPPVTPTRHFVTDDMEKLAAEWSNRVAPLHNAKEADGKEFNLAEALHNGPVFVMFIQDGCPCSIDAEPLFHRLYKNWAGKASFIGIIDVDQAKAAKWAKMNAMPYPIIPDPDKKLIHSFKATSAAFSALLTSDGKVEKMWPGYCQSYLKEMNSLIAKQLGDPVPALDTAYAPVKKTAGCAF
jgi:peroxiredoxin